MSKTYLITALLIGGLIYLLASCTLAPVPVPAPTPIPAPSPTPTPIALGAGFRFSTYGPAYNPGPAYWAEVGQAMAARFAEARPQAIWIVGNFAGTGPIFTFPGTHEDVKIHFSLKDQNEEALTLFDQIGLQVWLQVEPGDAPMEELIHIMLDRYGHHPCVIGVGVDVEWFESDGTPQGRAVTDAEAAAWVAAARSHNPEYRLFLKHWEQEMMPPTYRDGVLFVDDSQHFESLDHLVKEFDQWGQAFAPAPVAFQYGYPADQRWWGELSDPPGDIGREILANVPNTEGLFWVDFTALQTFPPNK